MGPQAGLLVAPLARLLARHELERDPFSIGSGYGQIGRSSWTLRDGAPSLGAMSSPSRGRSLAACSLALAGLLGALVPSAGAATLKARFTYTFVAAQQTQWSYNNGVIPMEDCGRPPALGSGTQNVSFTDAGTAVLETGFSRNVKKDVLFGAGTTTDGKAQGAYDRQGAFVIVNSQRGSCAQPDFTAPTQGCGAGRKPFRFAMDLRAGEFQVTGTALQNPYEGGLLDSCPFMYFATFAEPETFAGLEDSISNDLSDGLLGTEMKVSSAQFFKGKKVVLRGSRTQRYKPTTAGRASDPTGLEAQTTVAWMVTFKPVKRRR